MNGKGNVAAVLDGNQAVVAAYRYAPFGKLLAKTDSLTQPFGFSTKRYDEQTRLIYYGYRFYGPSIARWTTRDPLGEEGGMNLYAFVGNNPVNAIDPLGLKYMEGDYGQLHWVQAFGEEIGKHVHYSPNCEIKCITDQFGITTVVSAAGIALGQPLLKAPRKFKGATKGTSIASKYLSKALPQKLLVRVWALTLKRPLGGSKVLGRILGRWIPVAGWGLLAYDAVSIVRCMNNCHKDFPQCD